MLSRFFSLALIVCGLVPCASAEGPDVLFDGKTLDRFDVIGCEATVKDGAIFLQAGNGLIQTKNRYQDFVFDFEWKALDEKMWDSGVYFRYDSVPAGRPWPANYQVNLRKGQEGNLGGFDSGTNSVATKPGQWNRFELTVRGDNASLKVNGKPSWSVDGITQPEGYIALQAEVPGGGQFLFRKVRVTKLDAESGGQ
ncbi:3-keto-disaccharide hydrolase [Novipirellula artificiosorum]|uniref:3-keto-alpha-glucoside-1,2-lyase/3-keto-2-hydroxy-glucal hydratase domain-containing protein n=1 Tax=Novipirellula artificiosorum TaxID=2528016 RepID=A0A5C6DZW8_9BACT|nr:DUF1080 domain-containing protein [Novipirellula artificiosorum]TWU42188.1 hypothetical protein Poly41_04840 [Novipirellula artificiosorum]